MRTRRNGKRGGFTLIEIAIACAVLGLVLGALSGVIDSTRKSYGQGSAQARVQADARRAIDRIAAELENGGVGTLIPNPIGVAANDLVYQVVSGVNLLNNTVTFDNSSRLRFAYETGETNNNVDDDGDGLVDEGRVVLTRDYLAAGELSTTLVKGVSELLEGENANGADDNGNGFADERGFCMTLQGNLLVLRLTLARPIDGRSVVASVQTSVRLKN
ncbi:MAG TPA: prepilin-type N-terminal cleavage/methylation domain-containing protein [Planctomycetota bacterium]|nr:prepilin-type N-terminal cleavage/methylation domain-containing protein [Planctomycetota bacterium]